METNSNRSCDKCGASRFGSIEDYNKWIKHHNKSEHTTAQDLVKEEIQNHIDFLSGSPTKKAIEEEIERLESKLKEVSKRGVDPPDTSGANPHRLALA